MFVAAFFVLGLQLPYWPVWLKSQGLSPQWVGWLLSAGTWMRVFANPWVGRLADRIGRPRLIAVWLAGMVVLTYLGFAWATGLGTLLVLSFVLGAAFSPLVPLTDAIAVRAVQLEGSYGRLRRWGSASFIAASLVGGWLLEDADADRVLLALTVAAVALMLTASQLPKGGGSAVATRAPEQDDAETSQRSRRILRWFLGTTLVLHSAHAVLYGFGTAHWQARGIDESTIGLLWAIGVVCEIALFSGSGRWISKVAPSTWLLFSGLGGMVRWPILASTSSLIPLVFAQMFHALTFGALHLGAMEFIRQRIPLASTARATTAYSASSGVALGIGLPLSGWLYAQFEGATYWFMALMALTAVVLAIRLRRLVETSDAIERNATRCLETTERAAPH